MWEVSDVIGQCSADRTISCVPSDVKVVTGTVSLVQRMSIRGTWNWYVRGLWGK